MYVRPYARTHACTHACAHTPARTPLRPYVGPYVRPHAVHPHLCPYAHTYKWTRPCRSKCGVIMLCMPIEQSQHISSYLFVCTKMGPDPSTCPLWPCLWQSARPPPQTAPAGLPLLAALLRAHGYGSESEPKAGHSMLNEHLHLAMHPNLLK